MSNAKVILIVLLSLFAMDSVLAASPQTDIDEQGPAFLFQKLESKAPEFKMSFSDGSDKWEPSVRVVRKLPNGVVLVRAKRLTLDTDGASTDVRACDSSSQKDTSLSDGGKPIDANSISYIVLPDCTKASGPSCKNNRPEKQLGITVGNLAAVIANDRLAYAIAGDHGSEHHITEGSVHLHRLLGHETIGKVPGKPKCAANVSLESEVMIVIFPGSGTKWRTQSDIEKGGATLWKSLLATYAD